MRDERIVINYRRGDDPGAAGRLFDRLEQAFPKDALFLDVDSIPPRHDFVKVIDEQVSRCRIFLAVIGTNWLHATVGASGNRRLDNPGDFVRIEIEAALRRNIPIIPVLVNAPKCQIQTSCPKPFVT